MPGVNTGGRGALGTLPEVGGRRLAVRVTPDALRQIRGGHPWVFDRAVRDVSHQGRPGDLAVVFDERRRFAAIGLWDPTSPIRIRLLHTGAPRTIDEAFFAERIDLAREHRRPLLEDPTTTGFRIVNGESDGLGGLVVDRYADTTVIKLYSPAWFPHLAAVVSHVVERLAAQRIVLRLARTLAHTETHGLADGDVLVGEAPAGEVEFLEHGLVFGADVLHGQKTGHFLDQRDNRALVGGLAAGAEVLDVFSCTGGFSVHASAGGATSVHAVDRSAHALASAAANLVRNLEHPSVAATSFRTEEGDAFEVLEQHARAGRSWDLVVIDPPSFAPRAELVPRALQAYARLTELGLQVTRAGGFLVQSSCSSRVGETAFHAQIREVAARTGHVLEEVARTGHAIDHPVTHPEAAYLKTMFCRVDP